MCATCIQANNTTYVSKQLVHYCPLLTPFAIVSVDIWSPGDVISPTCAKCLLNCMCNMTKFVCSVALAHVNAAKLARAFVEGVLLKYGLCLVIVVDDDSDVMALFEATSKSLNIRLHKAAKRNHKAIGVERYYTFLNHNVKIISSVRQTHKCFVEVGHISVMRGMPCQLTALI